MAREISQLYANLFLNPPSTPMLVVDRQGQVHPLPFGIKSASELQETLAHFLGGSQSSPHGLENTPWSLTLP